MVVDLALARFSPQTVIPTTQLGRDMTRVAAVRPRCCCCCSSSSSPTSGDYGWGFFVDVILRSSSRPARGSIAQGKSTPVDIADHPVTLDRASRRDARGASGGRSLRRDVGLQARLPHPRRRPGRIGERRARLRALAEQEGGAGSLEVDRVRDARRCRGAPLRADARDRTPLPDRRRRRALERGGRRPAPRAGARGDRPEHDRRVLRARGGSREGAGGAARRGALGRRRRQRRDRGEGVGPPEMGDRARPRARPLARRLRRTRARRARRHPPGAPLARAREAGARMRAGCTPRRRCDRRAGRAQRRAPCLDARRRDRRARRRAAATIAFLRLRAQGERVESLSYWITRRLREALGVARALERGRRAEHDPRRAADAAEAWRPRSSPTSRAPTPRRSSARSPPSPTSSSTCAEARPSTRTRSRCARSARSRPRPPRRLLRTADCSSLPRADDPRGAGLLAGAGVAVQRARLDRLVDLRHQRAMLDRDLLRVALADGALEPAEVGLDRGGVVAVLETLALGAQDPLLLGGDVGHGSVARQSAPRGAVL